MCKLINEKCPNLINYLTIKVKKSKSSTCLLQAGLIGEIKKFAVDVIWFCYSL
jgi:hypothetical protein